MKYFEGDTNNEELQDLLSHDVSMKQSTKVKSEDNDRKCSLTPATSFLRETMKSIVSIYADQSGSLHNLCQGFFIIALAGTALGILMPKDENLPTPWCRLVSAIIGYIYFMIWSVSSFCLILLMSAAMKI